MEQLKRASKNGKTEKREPRYSEKHGLGLTMGRPRNETQKQQSLNEKNESTTETVNTVR